mgnify:CR=1 FL=1
MPTRRKIPRKNSGTKRTGRYQNSPDASIQKSAKPPSKFRNTIGYKKSARKKSPATTRKNSPKSSSDSSYEYKSESENEDNKSESDDEERGLSIDISKKNKTQTERVRKEGRTNDDENIDDIENKTSSQELAVTKIRKSIWASAKYNDGNYDSDDDSECIESRNNNKKRKKDDDDDSKQGGLLTNEMRKKENEITKLKRTIKTLETTINNMQRTSRSTSRDKTGWSGEDLMFVKNVNDFCKDKLYPKMKFLQKNWQEYLPNDRRSLYTVCMKHLSIPEGSEKRDIWDRVIVPSIRDKYQGMRCNMNNKIKSIYMSMIYLLESAELIIISHNSRTY